MAKSVEAGQTQVRRDGEHNAPCNDDQGQEGGEALPRRSQSDTQRGCDRDPNQ